MIVQSMQNKRARSRVSDALRVGVKAIQDRSVQF